MPQPPEDWIVPDWPVPSRVRALVTTRNGGDSAGPYTSMNLGQRVGDDPVVVEANRRRLRGFLPAEPNWLHQVHGSRVVRAEDPGEAREADAVVTRQANCVCPIMIADCMPVLFADREGSAIGAAHAGWRGLAAGVLENTISTLGIAPENLVAWLGPAIGPSTFEVGSDVRNAFVAIDPAAAEAFRAHGAGKWLADLFWLARQRLASAGVSNVYGGGLCTYSDPIRFFSHRRDKVSGRMAALIWME